MFHSVLESLGVVKGVYLQGKVLMHDLFFCVRTLCMNDVTKTFLLVSSSVSSKQLKCFVHGQGPKREQKHTTTTKNFVQFHNHHPLLTMVVDLPT